MTVQLMQKGVLVAMLAAIALLAAACRQASVPADQGAMQSPPVGGPGVAQAAAAANLSEAADVSPAESASGITAPYSARTGFYVSGWT